MLHALALMLLAHAPQAECTAPLLSYFYDARAVTQESYAKSCYVCSDRVTVVTEAWGTEHRLTRPTALPEMTDILAALARAPTDEVCDGPMDAGGVEYWVHSKPPVLFSAAGSACWVQSTAAEAAEVESLVDGLCGGVELLQSGENLP